MKKVDFTKTLSPGFAVLALLSRYAIECRACHARFTVPKGVVRNPSFQVLSLLNHEYSHKKHKMSLPSRRKIFGNNQREISFWEFPDAPRYYISEARIDWDRAHSLLSTDSLVEAELAFRQASAELLQGTKTTSKITMDGRPQDGIENSGGAQKRLLTR